MNTPAAAAWRILIGTGIGLLIVSGFLFSMELLPPVTCESSDTNCVNTNVFGWLIPISGFLFTSIGIICWPKPELLKDLFPNTNDEDRKKQHTESSLEEQLEDANSSDAWSSLEKKLLVGKVTEEE